MTLKAYGLKHEIRIYKQIRKGKDDYMRVGWVVGGFVVGNKAVKAIPNEGFGGGRYWTSLGECQDEILQVYHGLVGTVDKGGALQHFFLFAKILASNFGRA